MSPVQHYTKHTLDYIEQDLATFEAVVRSQYPGKLGVAMITNASAALDLFAWLLYQKFDLSVKNNDLFKKIISDIRFFNAADFVNPKVLYGVVRCGVVHQFYPKGIAICSIPRDEPFLRQDGKPFINAFGFYRTVFIGLQKVRDYILSESGAALADLDAKYLLRQKIDRETYDASDLESADIPST